MTDIREALARIKARAAEATPGPWTHDQAAWGLASNGPDHIEVSNFDGDEIASLELDAVGGDDAEFIAHARTDVDRLTEALESVLDELDRLTKENPPVCLGSVGDEARAGGIREAVTIIEAIVEYQLSEQEEQG